jgi:autophagy-related protein 27
VTRLSASDSDSSSEKEGIRIELNGGIYDSRKQKAVVEFICDPNWTGVEKRSLDDRSDNTTSSLTYIKYDYNLPGSDMDVLHLEWRTKYVCESQGGDGAQRSHWGFFTWFLIM